MNVAARIVSVKKNSVCGSGECIICDMLLIMSV